jgi:hypothetical protein
MTLILRAGDIVKFLNPQNQVMTGRVVMPSGFAGGYVVNTGGRYGTPAIVSEQNFVGFARRKLDKVV